ncbi:hypothetical protein [Methylobacterium brachythecii]|nr:hypothetical protein [Methylobacterium brachythecii]
MSIEGAPNDKEKHKGSDEKIRAHVRAILQRLVRHAADKLANKPAG